MPVIYTKVPLDTTSNGPLELRAAIQFETINNISFFITANAATTVWLSGSSALTGPIPLRADGSWEDGGFTLGISQGLYLNQTGGARLTGWITYTQGYV